MRVCAYTCIYTCIHGNCTWLPLILTVIFLVGSGSGVVGSGRRVVVEAPQPRYHANVACAKCFV